MPGREGARGIRAGVCSCCLTPSPGTPGEGRGEGSLRLTINCPCNRTITLTFSRNTGRGDRRNFSSRRAPLPLLFYKRVILPLQPLLHFRQSLLRRHL